MRLIFARKIQKSPRSSCCNIRCIMKIFFILGVCLYALIYIVLKSDLSTSISFNLSQDNDSNNRDEKKIVQKTTNTSKKSSKVTHTSSHTSSSSTNSDSHNKTNFIDAHPYLYSINNLAKLRGASPYFKSRNLVLSFAENVDDGYLSIFLNSLRESNHDAEVIIFINEWNVNSQIIQMSKKLRIRFVVFVRDKLMPTNIRLYHSSSLRYILYTCLLGFKDKKCNPENLKMPNKEQGSYINSWMSSHFTNVLLVDARDSFFQGNPFSFCDNFQTNVSKIVMETYTTWKVIQGVNQSIDTERWRKEIIQRNVSSLCKDKLYTGIETKSGIIGQSSFNSNWIKKCFNEKILTLLKNQNIVCSGIIFGDSLKMNDYIYQMALIFLRKAESLTISASCPTLTGADQGVHNVLISLGSVDNVKGIDEVVGVDDVVISSPFLNLLGSNTHTEHYTDKTVNKIENYYLPNQRLTNRILFPLVHQYDRISSLHRFLIEKYIPWVKVESELSELKKYHSCARFDLIVEQTDLNAGKCDLFSRPAISSERCCNLCSQQRESWLSKLTNIKSSKDFEKYLTESEKSVLLENLQINPGNYKNISLHSRNYYLKRAEKYKICTSFTYTDFKCFLKSCGSHNKTSASTLFQPSKFLIGSLKASLMK